MKKFVSLVFLLFCSCNEQQQEVDCSGVAGGDAICGCTDGAAANFSPIATYDDGTCEDCSGVAGGDAEYDNCGECEGNNSCYGCMNSLAVNYSDSATIDDESCVFEIVKLTFESTGSINAHFEITKEDLQRFRCTVFSYDDETVNIDSVWGHIEQGPWEDEFDLLNGIFNNVINISDLVDTLNNNTEISITVLLNNNDQQLHEDFYPSEELLAILYFIQNNVSEWCPVGYLKIDNICYHPGDMEILQDLVGNFAPSVLDTMDGPYWVDGRLVGFICEGCTIQDTLPPSLGGLNELRDLMILNTSLSGELPEALYNLENLSTLRLLNNELSGVIPVAICNFDVNNMEIDLSQNQFCPPYPECIEDYIGEQACDE